MTKKSSIGPNGEINSRETGHGLEMSPAQVEKINETRQGNNYEDVEASSKNVGVSVKTV